MKSIERIAMEIAGGPAHLARPALSRYGFTPADANEIVASHYRIRYSTIDPDWQAVAVTIRSVAERDKSNRRKEK